MLDFSRLNEVEVESYRPNERFGPISENIIRAFYQDILAPGDVAVDVGVHYGVHLFSMRECVGDTGLVYGIEANVERYAAVLKRLSNQGRTNVQLLHLAAAHEEGFRDFFVNRTHSGYSGLVANKKLPTDTIEQVTVFATALSAVIPRKLRPKFMKIDIEGAEFPALLGAKETIVNSRMLIIFEGKLTMSAEKFGYQTERVAEFIHDIGYCVFDLFGNPIGLAAWTGGFGWNFVAGPDNEAARKTMAQALTQAWVNVLAEESKESR